MMKCILCGKDIIQADSKHSGLCLTCGDGLRELRQEEQIAEQAWELASHMQAVNGVPVPKQWQPRVLAVAKEIVMVGDTLDGLDSSDD